MLKAYADSVQRHASRPAVICGDRELDYATLDARSNQLARHLTALGVGRNDVVGLLLPRGIELIVSIIAIMKAGGAYMPLDLRNPVARNATILSNTKARAAVSSTAYMATLPDGVAQCLVDRDAPLIAAKPATDLDHCHDGRSLAYVINTSGSTGEPKSAAVYHSGFANLLQWYGDRLRVTADDAVLIIGSATFDATQKNLFTPLLAGGRLIFPEGDLFDPEQLAELIGYHKVSWVNGTPSNFYPIAEGPGCRSPETLASLRWVVLGGETIQPHRLAPWLERSDCNARVLNTYGPTECTDICAAWAFDAHSAQAPIPIGLPIDNVGIAILDENGLPCAPGVEGELWICGAGIGAGYLGRNDLNAKSFVEITQTGHCERIYRTGDRVRWRPDGAIEFLGRIDTQVKLR
ncbi:MAG: amino acid adenylation domain-containing protein [Hyphomicrobiaceae bacterium]